MNFAIVLSGGVGSRAKTDVPKQYVAVAGMPVIAHTLARVQKCVAVDSVVVVAEDAWTDYIARWCDRLAAMPYAIAPAGASRQESILSGLEECVKDSHGPGDIVVIHDAARPMVTGALISSVIDGTCGHDGCMPVLGVTDTTYYSDDGRSVSSLLDRDRLFAGQAPEAFLLQAYLELCRSVTREELVATRGTTEIAVRHGMDVALVPGDPANFKITTAEDLERFRAIAEGVR